MTHSSSDTSASPDTSVLFVCMGNICRSPSAEGFFRHHLVLAGLDGKVRVDSAGTHSYHLGHAPDSRAIETAASCGVDIAGLQARKIRTDDFEAFDLIIAMDDDNLDNLQRFRAGEPGSAELKLMMEYSPRFADQPEVPDPYYGGMDGFNYMCELLDEATAALVSELKQQGAAATHGED